MNNINIRKLERRDIPKVKELVKSTFKYERFLDSKFALELVSNMYICENILNSSIGMIAEDNDNIVGVVLGTTEQNENRIGNTLDKTKLLWIRIVNKIANNPRKRITLFDKTVLVYEEFFKETKYPHNGSINLLIVSEQYRGNNIGNELLGKAFSHTNEELSS